jgi:hypothetical protein
MRRHHFVRATGIALAASITFTMAGCGSDGDAGADDGSGPNAAPSGGTITDQGKASASPAAVEPKHSTSVKSGSEKAAAETISGAELTKLLQQSMVKGGTAVIAMSSSQAEASTQTSGVVDYGTNPPSMSLTSKVEAMGGVESTIILVDGVMYMDMGEMSQGKFLKMPLGEEASQMLDLSQLDPAAAFKDMYGGLKDVTVQGKEKVAGGTFRRYDAQVSTDKLVKELPESARADFPKVAKYSFWFDDQDLVRQVVVDMGKSGTTTMTYDDWGKKVSIKAPAPEDVTEMPSTPQMPSAPVE